MALSFALLFCAGLFNQHLRNLRSIDLGFRPENLTLLHLDVSVTSHCGQGVERYYT